MSANALSRSSSDALDYNHPLGFGYCLIPDAGDPGGVLDAGHYTWEDGADEYAALVTSWWGGGYATAGSAAAR